MFSLIGAALLISLAPHLAGLDAAVTVGLHWLFPFGLFYAGYNIGAAIRDPFNAVNLLIAVAVAVRCRVRLWLVIPAWIIGFLASWLLSFLHRLHGQYLVWYEPSTVFWAIVNFQFFENLVIGAALLLNRWLVRRRRVAVDAAMPAVFD